MKNISLLILFSFILFSCKENEYFRVDQNWIDTNLKVVYIDSCMVNMSTVKIDSLITDQKYSVLVGEYTDVNKLNGAPLTGTTTAISYIELAKNPIENLESNTVFDSLVIEMRFNGTYMGDTLSDMNLLVYQMAEKMHLDVDDGREVYCNTTSFNLESSPLANVVIPVRPSNTSHDLYDRVGNPVEPVRIKLDHTVGLDLFNKIKNKADEVDDNDKFVNYFKGIAFVSAGANSIVGFKTDSTFKVKLHYHEKDDFNTEKEINFLVHGINHFSNINSNRTGTPLDGFSNTIKEIPSELINNQAYIQSGDGLYIKIDFPTISDIRFMSEYGYVERAVLELRPVIGTYGKEVPLPTALSIYSTTISGETETSILNSLNMQQSGNLRIDDQFGEKTSYSFDISEFIQHQMNATPDQKSYILLKLPEMASSVQRLVLGNSNHHVGINSTTFYNRAKLHLYCSMYDD